MAEYTDEQVAEIATKAANEALSKAGLAKDALDKVATQLKSDQQTFSTQQSDWKKQRNAAEDATFKDDMDGLAALQRSRESDAKLDEARRLTTEAQGRLQEADDRIRLLNGSTREASASMIASRFNVDSGMLIKFGGPDSASMEELAKALPKADDKQGSTQGQGATGGIDGIKPDSGLSRGGGSTAKEAVDAYLADPTSLANQKAIEPELQRLGIA